MKSKKIRDKFINKDLPVGSEDWLVEEYKDLSEWTVKSKFHQTSKLNIEGLYKPISQPINFEKL